MAVPAVTPVAVAPVVPAVRRCRVPVVTVVVPVRAVVVGVGPTT